MSKALWKGPDRVKLKSQVWQYRSCVQFRCRWQAIIWEYFRL